MLLIPAPSPTDGGRKRYLAAARVHPHRLGGVEHLSLRPGVDRPLGWPNFAPPHWLLRAALPELVCAGSTQPGAQGSFCLKRRENWQWQA